MAGYKERIAKGFAINIVMAFAIAILGYLTRIILAKNLSLKEYGLFYAVFSFVSFFNLFRDLGVGATSIKMISSYAASKNKKEIKTTFLSALLFQGTIVVIISLLLMVFADYLSLNFFKGDAFFVIIFLALSYIFSLTQDITSALSSGFQNMFYANISEFLRHVVIIFILLIGINYNRTAVLPAFAYFIVMLLLPILHLRIVLKFMPDFFRIASGNKIAKIKDMLKFAFPILISSIGGMLIAYSDTIMITYYKTLEDVGIYNAAIPISMILWYFGNSIAAIMLPVISEMWQKKQKEYVREGIALLHKYSFAAIIPFALLFVSFPEIIIRILFGEKYLGAALALQILSVGAIMYNIAIINANILVGLGKPKINSKIMIFAAIFNISLNTVLIPRYGIAGAATSTATSYFLIFVLNTINLKRLTNAKIPLMQYAKTIVGGLIFLGVLTYLKNAIQMSLYPKAAIITTISLLIYSGYLVLVKVIDLDEVKEISSRILKRS